MTSCARLEGIPLPRRRRTTTGDWGPGRPRRGDASSDASLRARIIQLYDELSAEQNHGATLRQLVDEAIARGFFVVRVLQRFARRSARAFCRTTIGADDPATGFPHALSNPLNGQQLYLREIHMTVDEYAEHFRAVRYKQFEQDKAEIRRLWLHAEARYGRGTMPPLPFDE